MKCVLGMLILALNLPLAVARPGGGPCARKLQATGERIQDSSEFTMYLQSLLEERVIQNLDLDHFVNALEQNKIINPIFDFTRDKNLAFHHAEFQKIIESYALDLDEIKKWSRSYLPKRAKEDLQKNEVQVLTEHLPIHHIYGGATFYLAKHPTLGEVVKILKPGGNYNNENDWDKRVWSRAPLKNQFGQPIHFRNQFHQAPGVNQKKLILDRTVMQECTDRKAQLPTVDDFIELIGYFDYKLKDGVLTLTEKGMKDLRAVFPDSNFQFWTVVDDLSEPNGYYAWIFNGREGRIAHEYMQGHEEVYFILCTGTLERYSVK